MAEVLACWTSGPEFGSHWRRKPLNHTPGSVAYSLSLLSSHYSDMTEIMLTHVIHPFMLKLIYLSGVNYRIFPAIRRGFRPSGMTSNN